LNYDPLFHIVLLEPEIPPNTGNIGRTCVAAGIKLWLVKPLGFSVADKDLKRAGMDYWQHLEWEVVDNWQHLQERLPETNFWYFTKISKKPYTAASYQTGDALVFGAESKGLPKELMSENQDKLLSVPMRTQVRSLNLSTTAGIVAYEAVRQATLAGGASLPIGESPC
jgi:tRNA (cytidine/uridine-2'-O-)-methyltransferase